MQNRRRRENMKRESPSRFSAKFTAEEVTQGIDGSALTAIITGSTSGIGAETARVLALRGVHVVMAVRNVVAAEKVREAIVEHNHTAKINIMELDLSSFESVRNFASNYKASGLPLNILINNAGLRAPFKLSKDNIELTFATNHLGHFLLTNLLLETMKETTEESGIEGRIVILSSEGHRISYSRGIRFNKINSPSGYMSILSYGQSKLANILHANELARRLREEGSNITINSVHPGYIDTKLVRVTDHICFDIYKRIFGFLFKSIEQGAATTCYVAMHPQVKGISGEYFANCKIGKANLRARDLNLANKLWEFSIELVNKGQHS